MDASTQFDPGNANLDLRFVQLFEAAAIGIGICDFDGRILEANSMLGHMLRCERKDLIGIDLWNLHDLESHDVDSTKAASINESPLRSELMLGERDSFAVENRYRRTDGSEFWGHLSVSLARDPHGEPAFMAALLEDVTEPRRVQESLRQAEKMEVIGRLAGGIAHDFNNLLTGILLYSDLILAQLEPEDRIHHYVEEVRLAGEQGAALTQQLLAMARKQALQPRPLAINEIVSSTENLLRRLIGEQIKLVTSLDPLAGLVLFDPGQLRQILLNLVLNARDATRQGGTIRLSTRLTEPPNTPAMGKHRPVVSLIVEDNGCGMNAETRARLFEPFFTTKRVGEGTGMGLATVQHIVHEAGGLIEVTSAPECGTRIEVFLPALPASRNVPLAHVVDSQLLNSQLLDSRFSNFGTAREARHVNRS